MKFLTVLCAVPALALASPAQKTHRVSPLLIAMDQAAESKSLKIEGYMNDALEDFPNVVLTKSDDLFGIPPDDEGEVALKKAEAAYAEARISFDATQYEDAEKKLRNALRDYQRSASAMRDTTHYCDALAMNAAVIFQRGDAEEAKLILLDMMSLNPTFELHPKRFTREFLSLRAQVATSRNAALRGNIHVASKPAGARIFLDGELQGFTPATLTTLPAGRHLLRIERPGFKQYGLFVEVSPEDLEISAELRPTTAYRAYDALLDKVAAEVVRNQGTTAIASLGKALGLDRAIVGVVKQIDDAGATEVITGLFDMRSGKRLSARRVVFQGDEYGQLKGEVARLVTYLVVSAEGEKQVVRSSDPLDGKYGTEDWNAEDKGGKSANKTKKSRYHDPLDGVSGTEDW